MAEWRVDPDGVMGVLAGLDELGASFEAASTAAADAASGSSSLVVDARPVMSEAWSSFMTERSTVPGKVMFSVCDAAQSLAEATSAVVAGAELMSAETTAASAHAFDAWGIAVPSAYAGV
ncbi:MAG: DUF6507 family protein [Pseudoclavibacter sp.]